MRRSREDTAARREDIVQAAARLFRKKGLAAVSVADIMGSLGLTVGGFYRHFESKEALVAEAIESASMETTARHRGNADAEAILATYLSETHRQHPEAGCPVAALCSEVAHESRTTKKAFTAALQRLIGTIEAVAPAERSEMLRTAASIVGAVVLARATDNDALAGEILAAVRKQESRKRR